MAASVGLALWTHCSADSHGTRLVKIKNLGYMELCLGPSHPMCGGQSDSPLDPEHSGEIVYLI